MELLIQIMNKLETQLSPELCSAIAEIAKKIVDFDDQLSDILYIAWKKEHKTISDISVDYNENEDLSQYVLRVLCQIADRDSELLLKLRDNFIYNPLFACKNNRNLDEIFYK